MNYRYNYQGQENAVNSRMDNFELRMLNTDLGRWISPDPAGQFASPYISMGNNPVSGVDPDGGYYWNRNGDIGNLANRQWMQQQRYEHGSGEYSYEAKMERYWDDYYSIVRAYRRTVSHNGELEYFTDNGLEDALSFLKSKYGFLSTSSKFSNFKGTDYSYHSVMQGFLIKSGRAAKYL